jgi:hypothetical protein
MIPVKTDRQIENFLKHPVKITVRCLCFCVKKFNLNLGFTIVCLSNEMIYKYSFQIFIYGEIVLFLHHTTNHLCTNYLFVASFFFDPESALFYFSLIRILSKIPGFSSIFKLLYGINDKRLETEVFGLKFKKSSRTCSWFDKDAFV